MDTKLKQVDVLPAVKHYLTELRLGSFLKINYPFSLQFMLSISRVIIQL